VKIFLLTDIPSPYQVEVLNQIAQDKDLILHVGYLRRADPSRRWSSAHLSHEYVWLDDGPRQFDTARQFAREADLAIFNYYLHPHAEVLIQDRALTRRPWCFWGERPGLRKPEWVGRLFRSWKLRWLHSSEAPIWGIGKFAIERYQAEFGLSRKYFNLPYFSDLDRFANDRTGQCDKQSGLVFLFSGSLINRKGIDLLARAFVRLLSEGYNAELQIIGEGELRRSLEKTLEPVLSSVKLLGFVEWKDLPSYYRACDVLCVPSRYDGWGLVVPEGLASGLPVIATDRMGAALEFIQSGKNGWLIPSNDEEAIFEAMREAVTLSSSSLALLRKQAEQSVSSHSLHHGATKFKQYSLETVANWQS
jgi:glycosyltransferase involved in cell wall biosynthesis